MDPNAASITPEKIRGIYDILYDAMVDGIEKMEISDDESRKSAEYILQNLDSVKTQAELMVFLEQLCKSWPAYNNAYQKLLNEQKAMEDRKKITEVENSINSITDNI